MRGIQRETSRMGVLVDDLLLLARLDQHPALDLRPVDLGEVAREAVEAARAVDPGRPVVLEVTGPVVVRADAERVRRVADNLLANVRVHTPAGTPATVRVLAEEGSGVLTVRDEGPGMSPEDAARAFDRFHRGEPGSGRPPGTGLGLAIVHAVAAAHGGQATLESAPGAGVAVRVSLPSGGPAEM